MSDELIAIVKAGAIWSLGFGTIKGEKKGEVVEVCFFCFGCSRVFRPRHGNAETLLSQLADNRGAKHSSNSTTSDHGKHVQCIQ